VANGTTTITASAAGVDGTTTLTVTQAVASIVVSPADPTLTALGATQAFTAQAFDALNQCAGGAAHVHLGQLDAGDGHD
jgi:hypothetical protein